MDGPRSCKRTDREYNIPLRIGLLFAILVTSSFGESLNLERLATRERERERERVRETDKSGCVGVFAPILLARYLPSAGKSTLVILKQFGTGVIISTSLVHVRT